MRWATLWLSLLATSAMAQNITRLEYFFDNDPGFGNGLSINVTPLSPDRTVNPLIPLSGLSSGFHMLYLRSKDANARWSLLTAKGLFVQPFAQAGPSDNISFMEYFLDTDPGFGNGTPIPFTSGTDITQNMVLNLGSVSPGFHKLFVRAKSGTGRWSLLSSKTFVAQLSGSNIIAVQYYYFDGTTQTPIRTYTSFTPGQNVTIDFNAIIVGLLPSTSYEIHITALNVAGQRSREIVQSFTTPAVICNITSPTSSNANRCDNGTITLSASGAGSTPANYNWFDVATGGVVLVSGAVYTPTLSATQTFYVEITDGLGICESVRTPVTATIGITPLPPSTTGNSTCAPTSLSLTASGGTAGEYRWYTDPTGGIAIPGETSGTYITPVLNTSATYYVSINTGLCESPRSPVTAMFCNRPPSIDPVAITATTGGITTVPLLGLIHDPDNNVDSSSLNIVASPQSGALATIDASFNLTLNYEGISFSGVEAITIGICDLGLLCSQQVFFINVSGDVVIFNAVSPNGDGKNDYWHIQNIDALADFKENRVSIFNRWGDIVFETENYDNVNRLFKGLNTRGGELPTGTYFYRIEFESGLDTKTGYLSLRR